jgi:protease IV
VTADTPGPIPPSSWTPPPAPRARTSSPWKWGCGLALAGCLALVAIVALIGVLGLVGVTRSSTQVTGEGGPIAVIHIDGMITTGDSGMSLLGGQVTGSDDVVKQLKQATDDAGVKAILLRVNSPGGSAAASQEIYNAVARARRAGKKVVVSMADMAASGGYYISCNADRIYANPATLTGSIGVITTHQNMQGLMNKVGVTTETIKSGPLKDMFASNAPLTDPARQVMRSIIMQVYEQFLGAVSAGRKGKLTAAQVRKLADGRVYSGEQAKQVGLIDELGGMTEALQGAAKLAGIAGEPTTREYGQPGFLRRLLGTSLKTEQSRPVIAAAGGLLYDAYAAQLVAGPWSETPRPVTE